MTAGLETEQTYSTALGAHTGTISELVKFHCPVQSPIERLEGIPDNSDNMHLQKVARPRKSLQNVF